MVDAPNVALDRLMSMMALPCPNKGCTELVYLNKMEAHMETCKFRLQACPNKERGCKVTLPAKVDFCQCLYWYIGRPVKSIVRGFGVLALTFPKA